MSSDGTAQRRADHAGPAADQDHRLTAEDVVELVGWWQRADVRFWLDGGWGVDALLGRQSRPHTDIDVVVEHQDLAAFAQVMVEHGFRRVGDDDAFTHRLCDGTGRRVVVALVDLEVPVLQEPDGTRVYGGNGLAYEEGSLAGTGTVLGVTVPCTTPEFQIRARTDAARVDLGRLARVDPTGAVDRSERAEAVSAASRSDIALLATRFGLALPTGL
ncbi:nucleotidyltransferase domain-containing protein [Nakamurella leprariae]|uniref:Amino acid transporter n=1 Tax=Nakamurella leprariae TaxID=2803911 RepID=A0A938Y8Y3_9ACTN|nr:hypothetical protein [Nakamurella leprariae]MBM9466157.1 hypothetical protein [Nakamurella leprariae]